MPLVIWHDSAKRSETRALYCIGRIPGHSIWKAKADELFVVAIQEASRAKFATDETKAREHASVASLAVFALERLADLDSGD